MPTREEMQADFERALRTMDEFTAGEAPVQKAARKVARALEISASRTWSRGRWPWRRTAWRVRRWVSI